ncbi:MAG TPA: acyltransferase [Ktedonobacterales bacterium]|nr:acyltransferase [Ktedonobacterales bacterium]
MGSESVVVQKGRESARVERIATAPRAGLWRPDWRRILLPLDNGPAEIRALDGLRAIAALSIVLFHVLLFTGVEYQPWSQAAGNFWYVLATGVQLFFTLSGFLLFRPYALAMLTGKPLPSTARFYKKRALRILPAYWVALAILLAFNWQIAKDPAWLNGLTHALFIHDIFPRFNRDLDGPFWTLAVEAQFYLLLPWIAAGVAWAVGHAPRGGRPQTAPRVIVGLLCMIVASLTIRWFGIQVMGSLPASAPNADWVSTALWWLGLLINGMQGKYLEVFLVGAIAATIYAAAIDLGGARRVHLRPIGNGLALFGLAVMVPCAIAWQSGVVLYQAGAQWGWDVLLYPLATGVGYSAILLGVVWGGARLRAPFEYPALRFIGFISYSLYIWHLPILHGDIPPLQPVPLIVRLALVFAVSYLSYQLVERPFLQRHHRLAAGSVAR